MKRKYGGEGGEEVRKNVRQGEVAGGLKVYLSVAQQPAINFPTAPEYTFTLGSVRFT